MNTENIELAELARALREAFAAKKTIVERRTYRPHKRYQDQECWMRTAAVVKRLNATPEDYINAQFRGARSTVWANTLHGPEAQKRYRSWLVSINYDRADKLDVDTDSMLPPGKADVISRIDGFREMLIQSCGTCDVSLPEVRSTILLTPWLYDPVVAIVLAGSDQAISSQFLSAAKAQIEADPYLLRALKDLTLPTHYFDANTSY